MIRDEDFRAKEGMSNEEIHECFQLAGKMFEGIEFPFFMIAAHREDDEIASLLRVHATVRELEVMFLCLFTKDPKYYNIIRNVIKNMEEHPDATDELRRSYDNGEL